MNTVIFTIATIILKTVIALALAVLLTSGVRRLSYLYRALIYLPALLPMVAVGIVFKSHPRSRGGPAELRTPVGRTRSPWRSNGSPTSHSPSGA